MAMAAASRINFRAGRPRALFKGRGRIEAPVYQPGGLGKPLPGLPLGCGLSGGGRAALFRVAEALRRAKDNLGPLSGSGDL